MEVTTSPKPSMERAGKRPREQAGRNMRERRAGLENSNVGADPPMSRGRPLSLIAGSDSIPQRSHRGSGDGMPVHGDGTQHGRSSVVGA